MNYYFITGTSRGIGKALAEHFLAREASHVTGIARTCALSHDAYQHISVDFADLTEVLAKADGIFPVIEQAEHIILVNNAGIVGEIGYAGEISNESLVNLFNVNTVVPSLLTNSFIKAYRHLPCPKTIINISSGAGQKPTDGWAGYCASKAAIDMFSKTVQLEQEQRKENLKIFSVAPGVVDTQMQQEIREADRHQFSQVDRFIQLKKQKLLLPPESVAKKIDYLLKNREKFREVLQDVRSY